MKVLRDKRGQRRRFLYGENRIAAVGNFPIRRADPKDPLLQPGECRLEGGQIVVKEYTAIEQLEYYTDPREDPFHKTPLRFLAYISVAMGNRYRAGILMGLKIAGRI